eukprot:226046-Prymnesium_polylepis.1
MAAGLLAGCGCSCPHIRLGVALSARPAGQLSLPAAQELSAQQLRSCRSPPTAAPELHPPAQLLS